tara:strand:- start:23 stop:568 length:546 start_codon:yes stop_codon:yes gene_type:complete
MKLGSIYKNLTTEGFKIKEVSKQSLVSLPDDALTIMSTDKIINVKSVKQVGGDYKPKGLWYAYKDEWVEWVRMEMPDWEKPYLHQIVLDYSNIIILKTYEDIRNFSKEYSVPISTYKDIINDKNKNNYTYINWEKVANKYKGIEIIPYVWEARYDFMWYYGWDVASGCIWDSTAIKNIKRL